MSETLESRLREVTRDLRIDPPAADLSAQVLARVAEVPVPVPSWRARSRVWIGGKARLLGALLVALVATLVVVAPVGATIAEWFGFHGVVVSSEPGQTAGEPNVPPVSSGLTIGEAAELVGFTPLVPEELGKPDGVRVSEDGRVLSLSWGSGPATIRLDQFDGTLSPVFWKSTPDAQRVTVGQGDALWFPTPHEVVMIDEDGAPWAVAPRLAAQTLVWPVRNLTMRLEGDLDRATAIAIAESA